MIERVRLRLAAWNLGVVALVVAVVIGASIASEVEAKRARLEQELQDGAQLAARKLATAIRDAAADGGSDDAADAPEAEDLDDEDVVPGERRELLMIAVRASDGRRFSNRRAPPTQAPDEVALAAALRGEAGSSATDLGNAELRVVSLPVYLDGAVVGAVQVARSTGAEDRALAENVATLVAIGGVGLLLAGLSSLFLASRAIRPIGEALERQRRFVADASHELRTPLAVIRARVEALVREAAQGESGLSAGERAELDRLGKDAEELTALLADLLDLARLDANQSDLRREPIPLGDVAEELVEQLAPLAAEREIELRADVAPVFARADSARVRQVLRALLDNALKHAPRGGHVRVEVRATSRGTMLRVIDDGEGIPREHLARVFDRFHRVDAARTRSGAREGGASGASGGAGLGLAIAAELVRLMNGSIRAESAEGRGATFVVELPAA